MKSRAAEQKYSLKMSRNMARQRAVDDFESAFDIGQVCTLVCANLVP